MTLMDEKKTRHQKLLEDAIRMRGLPEVKTASIADIQNYNNVSAKQ